MTKLFLRGSYRKVGTHRRVRYADLVAYQEREREERHRGLDELVALSEGMGLYQMEPSGSAGSASQTSRGTNPGEDR